LRWRSHRLGRAPYRRRLQAIAAGPRHRRCASDTGRRRCDALRSPWRGSHAGWRSWRRLKVRTFGDEQRGASLAECYPQVGHQRIAQFGDQLALPPRVRAVADPHPGHRRYTFPGARAPAALAARPATLRPPRAAGVALARAWHATPSAGFSAQHLGKYTVSSTTRTASTRPGCSTT
jgi:hypothetical protein